MLMLRVISIDSNPLTDLNFVFVSDMWSTFYLQRLEHQWSSGWRQEWKSITRSSNKRNISRWTQKLQRYWGTQQQSAVSKLLAWRKHSWFIICIWCRGERKIPVHVQGGLQTKKNKSWNRRSKGRGTPSWSRERSIAIEDWWAGGKVDTNVVRRLEWC